MKKQTIQSWVRDNWIFVSFIASATFFVIKFWISTTNLESQEPGIVRMTWANKHKIDSLEWLHGRDRIDIDTLLKRK